MQNIKIYNFVFSCSLSALSSSKQLLLSWITLPAVLNNLSEGTLNCGNHRIPFSNQFAQARISKFPFLPPLKWFESKHAGCSALYKDNFISTFSWIKISPSSLENLLSLSSTSAHLAGLLSSSSWLNSFSLTTLSWLVGFWQSQLHTD